MLESLEEIRVIKELGGQGAIDALPPFIAYAVTVGDAPVSETVGTVTTRSVTAYVNGSTTATSVTLQYGQAAPGAGEYWFLLLPNFRGPGILLVRYA